ncbi:MAG: ParB/RepB/Spo0J family partition protein [Bacillota bacterium]|nr:ParB/RepB/Spo0J family partition protein [Bacillota bacterium]
MQRRGLGRGLEAILGAAVAGPDELRNIPVGDVDPNPHQPRSGFDEQRLQELAASIREHGVVQPVLVRPIGDRFELVAGERRWRAAQVAGLETVPAMVRALNDRQSLELALVENLQREDLNALEQARAFRELMLLLGATQEQVAERLGLSRPAVANALRLLSLCDEVQGMVASGELTAGHARALVGLDELRQRALAAEIVGMALTVRETEDRVRGQRERGAPDAVRTSRRVVAAGMDPDVADVEQRLRDVLGTEVRLRRRGRGGSLQIRFFSDDDLERLLDLLLRAERGGGRVSVAGH